MDYHYDALFQRFCIQIIEGKCDTKDQAWENICEQLVNRIANFDIKLLSPKNCIDGALASNTTLFEDFNKLKKNLDDLENAFYCLSQYALNLCRNPHRPEYGLLKTYTGYYATNILSIMNDNDRYILESMGYKVSASGNDNNDEFDLPKVNKEIRALSFQLFLAQPYCRKVKAICEEAHEYGMGNKDIVNMLANYNPSDILDITVRILCEQKGDIDFAKTPNTNYEQNWDTYKHQQHPAPRLVDQNHDDDDDLYGGNGEYYPHSGYSCQQPDPSLPYNTTLPEIYNRDENVQNHDRNKIDDLTNKSPRNSPSSDRRHTPSSTPQAYQYGSSYDNMSYNRNSTYVSSYENMNLSSKSPRNSPPTDKIPTSTPETYTSAYDNMNHKNKSPLNSPPIDKKLTPSSNTLYKTDI